MHGRAVTWMAAGALALASILAPAGAAECALAAGFVGKGLGLRFHFRPEGSHWRFGYEYGRMPAHTDEDPFTGRPLTREVESLTGPFVDYQFHPEARRGGYVGVSVLRWSRTEESLVARDEDRTSTTDLYVGGGYTWRPGKHFLFEAALFVAPGAEMKTETRTSSTENSGNFDLHIVMGGRF